MKDEHTILFGDIEVKINPGLLKGLVKPNYPLNKMGPILANTYKQYQGQDRSNDFLPKTSMSELYVHKDGAVSIDAIALGEGPELQDMIDELTPHGFKVHSTYRHVASGKIPIESLGQMCKCSTMLMAMPALSTVDSSRDEPHRQRRRATGSVTSEGVLAMEVDKVLEDLGFNGSGVKVGVLSDSFNYLGGADDDIASGDLPPADRIDIIEDSAHHIDRDEGRAMMQVVHDVAPGADLAFHTARGGEAIFANGIRKLAALGCNIIVDDIFVLREPAFQDGIIAQAVDEVIELGVSYFSSAGNYGRSSWEGAFVDSGVDSDIDDSPATYRWHDWAYGSQPVPELFQTVFLPNVTFVDLLFQWDEPFASATPGSPGSSSDLDLFLVDLVRRVMVKIGDEANIGKDPIEIIRINVKSYLQEIGRPDELGHNFGIAIGLDNGEPPTRMKLTVLDSNARFLGHPTNRYEIYCSVNVFSHVYCMYSHFHLQFKVELAMAIGMQEEVSPSLHPTGKVPHVLEWTPQ